VILSDIPPTEQAAVFKVSEEIPSDVVSDAALTATRSIGGHKGHVTKLLLKLGSLLETKESNSPSEALGLQKQIRSAHDKYTASVREYCRTLDEESDRYRELMDQWLAKDKEVKQMEDEVNAFFLRLLPAGLTRLVHAQVGPEDPSGLELPQVPALSCHRHQRHVWKHGWQRSI